MLRPLLLGLAMLQVGCLAAGPAPEPAAVPATAPATEPATAPAPATETVMVLQPNLALRAEAEPAPIGVAACDRYLALVDACPASAPARSGGTKRLLDKDAASWREAARSSTEGRLAVTMACEAAIQGLRQNPCR